MRLRDFFVPSELEFRPAEAATKWERFVKKWKPILWQFLGALILAILAAFVLHRFFHWPL
jgi:hypothetical protein